MISYVLPTRDRPQRLRATLEALGQLDASAHRRLAPGSGPAAEVIVVDNDSRPPVAAPVELNNGFVVRVLHRHRNEGAAARNAGAHEARGDWLVMLDDDSHPSHAGLTEAIESASRDTAAIQAEIFLPDGSRERGGLPEVFIGCGVAIRRGAFLEAGGYDPRFGFYAEEYDLSAKLMARGGRIVMDRRFQVRHEKTDDGRNTDLILRRLVRNNAWVWRRHAPKGEQRARLRETFARYARIAEKERALGGYALGAMEALASLWRQARAPLSDEVWDRFIGLHAVRSHLERAGLRAGSRVALVDRGKHDWVIERALTERGFEMTEDAQRADALMIGTLSPGPMLDALDRRRAAGEPVIAPWAADAWRGASAQAA